MRKIFCAIFGFIVFFGNANAVSDETLINQLVKEKNEKLATLEQCTKKVTGFKVAGISTLGLTAVGVVGNIALKNKNNEMDNKIAFAKNELQRQQESKKDSEYLQKTLAERMADCDKHKDIAKWDGENCNCFDKDKNYHDGKCWNKDTDCFVAYKLYNLPWDDEVIELQKNWYDNADRCDANYFIPFLSDSSKNHVTVSQIRKKCEEICYGGQLTPTNGRDAKEIFATFAMAELLQKVPNLQKCLQENPEQGKLFGTTILASLPNLRLYSCDN